MSEPIHESCGWAVAVVISGYEQKIGGKRKDSPFSSIWHRIVDLIIPVGKLGQAGARHG